MISVRVLFLFHNKYIGYSSILYCIDYVQLVATTTMCYSTCSDSACANQLTPILYCTVLKYCCCSVGLPGCLDGLYRHYFQWYLFRDCSVIIVAGACSFCWNLDSFLLNWQKLGSSGMTQCGVWIGNCNLKLWKYIEDKLQKIWRSLTFCKNWGNQAHPWSSKYVW